MVAIQTRGTKQDNWDNLKKHALGKISHLGETGQLGNANFGPLFLATSAQFAAQNLEVQTTKSSFFAWRNPIILTSPRLYHFVNLVVGYVRWHRCPANVRLGKQTVKPHQGRFSPYSATAIFLRHFCNSFFQALHVLLEG